MKKYKVFVEFKDKRIDVRGKVDKFETNWYLVAKRFAIKALEELLNYEWIIAHNDRRLIEEYIKEVIEDIKKNGFHRDYWRDAPRYFIQVYKIDCW